SGSNADAHMAQIFVDIHNKQFLHFGNRFGILLMQLPPANAVKSDTQNPNSTVGSGDKNFLQEEQL
ncbi:MAG: hypothetical protein LUF77_03950, partial [Oscillospiraceae bacterium]|nr:hypothetical protein [Oscillospiraceae bacterium]